MAFTLFVRFLEVLRGKFFTPSSMKRMRFFTEFTLSKANVFRMTKQSQNGATGTNDRILLHSLRSLVQNDEVELYTYLRKEKIAE